MLILIAESKTMTACSEKIGGSELQAHCPVFDKEANQIMESLKEMNVELLSEKVKISIAMARKLHDMIYDFPNKSTGSKAIEAFTGVVFKAFNYPSLNDECKSSSNRMIRIISSLYGLLRPDDIVKAYRFDYTTPLAPGGKSFASFWKDKVTELLIAELAQTGCKDILNLLPGDAAKSIDWKSIEKYAKVWRADFQEVTSAGTGRTPNAGKLKTLRGKLLRQIITEGILDPHQLLNLTGNDYYSASPSSSDGTILFHTA